jgi:predicted polyphosphate/ATP-dependent NAD kinase
VGKIPKKLVLEGQRMKKIIGLIVNPVAGMGGSVGLKGTDGEMFKKSLGLGAKTVTPARTKDFLTHIKNKQEIIIYTAPGKMGEEHVSSFDIQLEVIGTINEETTAEDSKKIALEMLNSGIDLLIFVGGDGTARDIYDAVDSKIPVIAVPSGVKVFSSVFAVSARAAAEILDAFIEGTDITEEEVLDIDESAFREGKLASRLYGSLLVPNVRNFLQAGKEASSTSSSSIENKKDVAQYIVEGMDHEILYLLGPGTTVKAVTDELKLNKTLLGIDAIFDGELVDADLNEKGILELFKKYKKKKIVVTPLGGNGFIFGRGNKQFTPEVIKKIGKENIIIVGTKDKVNSLDCLRVDTGNFEVDELFFGYIKVIIGYKEEMLMEVKC